MLLMTSSNQAANFNLLQWSFVVFKALSIFVFK